MNTVTDLCSFVAIFTFILSFDYRQYRHTFYSILKGFFRQVYLLPFCSLWASGMKLSYSLHVENTNTKKIPFNWLHSFFTWLFLYHKEVESLFQHVTLCMTIFLQMKLVTRTFTANSNMQIWYDKISILTHCLLAQGPDLFVYTSSSVAFFLMQWEKSTVIFSTHFICVWLRTCSTISSWLERIRNLLICCRIQQKVNMKLTKFARDSSTKGVHVRNLLICYRI